MAIFVRERLSETAWTSPTAFTLDGLHFELIDWDVDYQGDAYPIIKGREYLEAYREVLASASVERVMELGIRLGGSSVFFNTLLKPRRMVSIDITRPVRRLEQYRASHAAAATLATYYRTSQDDEAALNSILEREMDGPLDLVLDDASHFYEQTKASFEILFPKLRPGGLYVVEDWSWAHIRGFGAWRDQPALSNLIFQLMMIAAGRPELIAQVTVFPGLAVVRKGSTQPSAERLDLTKLCWMQNRTFHLL